MKLSIIGASGHGKVVADVARLCGYNDIVFLDDDDNLNECAGWPVVGKCHEAPDGEVFVAIGNATIREKLMDQYRNRKQPVLIHPSSVIAEDVEIVSGSVIMAGAVINLGAKVGKGCIVNTSSSIDHDCVIGDYCHISVGAHLCGTVIMGNSTWIGAGAIVSNNISICEHCVIGAGAVVIRDIKKQGTYVGLPANLIQGDKQCL